MLRSKETCFNHLTKAIETDGFKIEDIGLIINTHHHSDHCGANESIIQKNKVDLQILYTPGHSPRSICLCWPDNKRFITGDVVFYGRIGRTDLHGGSSLELTKSIDKLSRLDIEYLVPGHSTKFGNIIEGKQNVERNFQTVKLFF